MITVPISPSFYAYLIVLSFHAGYAAWLIFQTDCSLAVGKVAHPAAILSSLLLINGISLSVFFWRSSAFISLNAFFHAGLAVDEIYRSIKEPRRWPFFLFHLFFLAILLHLLSAPTT